MPELLAQQDSTSDNDGKRHDAKRCAERARCKIDHKTCNTLPKQDDNFAYTYRHDAQHLSAVFAIVMQLALLVDQTPQR